MSVVALAHEALFALARFPYLYRLKNLSDRLVSPYISLDFSNQFYQVKTVDTVSELEQVLRLRYEVFFQEFSSFKGQWNLIPYDVDLHDFICDHLVVKDLKSDRVVACYRLLSSKAQHRIDHYYSEGEFGLDEFLRMPGHKLELGRACVQKDFRKGTVIALLWKGLLEYAKRSESRWLFGCSSIARKDFDKVGTFLAHLEETKALTEGSSILPTKKYDPARFQLNFSAANEVDPDAKRGLSALIMMYLKAGAKMSPHMAYDPQMDCLDFFTVMDFEKMNDDFERKFSA